MGGNQSTFKYPGSNSEIDQCIRVYIDRKNQERKEYGVLITELYQPYKKRLDDAKQQFAENLKKNEEKLLPELNKELEALGDKTDYTTNIKARVARIICENKCGKEAKPLSNEYNLQVSEIKREWGEFSKAYATAHYKARYELYSEMLNKLKSIAAVDTIDPLVSYIPFRFWKDM